jgi:hypothetical protein
MSEKAVIDRFEGDQAVLLLGDGSERINVPRDQLPQGAREGDWLQVERDGQQVQSCRLDHEETESARRRIQDKLDRLRRGNKNQS